VAVHAGIHAADCTGVAGDTGRPPSSPWIPGGSAVIDGLACSRMRLAGRPACTGAMLAGTRRRAGGQPRDD
jgi:hypothetical protein